MNIGIAGGGIAGLTFLNFAQREGWNCSLYEQKDHLLEQGSGIALGINAMKILTDLELYVPVMGEGRMLDVMSLTDADGRTISRTDLRAIRETTGLPSVCIQRSDLHRLLGSRLNRSKIFTGRRITGVQTPGGEFGTQNEQRKVLLQSGEESLSFDLLIGADGIRSTVRDSIEPVRKYRYSGYTCWRFIVDLPESVAPVAYEMLGRGRRFGIAPVKENRVYCYATENAPAGSFSDGLDKRSFAERFREFNGPVPAILDALIRDDEATLIHRDLADLYRAVLGFPESHVLLIGDAAHATTPNLGQGAAMGMEDAKILVSLLREFESIPQLIRRFIELRQKRVEMIRSRSFWLGKINQLENRALRSLRDTAFRSVPEGTAERGLIALLLEPEMI